MHDSPALTLSPNPLALPARARRGSVLASTAMALVIAYIVIDVALQAVSPHYSPVSDAESNLAVGPFGWVMQANFASRAVMSGCLVGAIWLTGRSSSRKSIGLALVALAWICSLALVFAAADINRPGEFGMTPRTLVGAVHVVFASAGFIGILIGMLSLGASLAFYPQVAGLAERLCLLGILGWAFFVSLGIRRQLTPLHG